MTVNLHSESYEDVLRILWVGHELKQGGVSTVFSEGQVFFPNELIAH